MDFLSNCVTWLNGFRSANLTTLRTYRRGGAGGTVISIPMTLGETSEEAQSDDGVIVEVKVRDYIITVTDLVMASAPIIPTAGDQIVEADGAVFEVMSRPNEGPWRWSDPFRLAYRVHTKKVG